MIQPEVNRFNTKKKNSFINIWIPIFIIAVTSIGLFLGNFKKVNDIKINELEDKINNIEREYKQHIIELHEEVLD